MLHCRAKCTGRSSSGGGDLDDQIHPYWREAQDAQDEDGKFAFGFTAGFDRGPSPTKLKVTCRIAKTIRDESEVEDPRQQKLL